MIRVTLDKHEPGITKQCDELPGNVLRQKYTFLNSGHLEREELTIVNEEIPE
jgi:hypothetical protein